MKCEVPKPVTEFHRDKSRPSGRHPYCKTCQTAKASQWCRENRERARENEQRYKRTHRVEINLKSKDYRKENRDKVSARAKANAALRTGKIVKPGRCSRCPRRTGLTMHHTDYSRPLDVIWLCGSCHMREHRGT